MANLPILSLPGPPTDIRVPVPCMRSWEHRGGLWDGKFTRKTNTVTLIILQLDWPLLLSGKTETSKDFAHPYPFSCEEDCMCVSLPNGTQATPLCSPASLFLTFPPFIFSPLCFYAACSLLCNAFFSLTF